MVRRRIARRLLRRHVRGRADARAHLRQRAAGRLGLGRGQGLGDAEVGHDRRVARQQDVLGFDVAVDHTLCVRVGQGPRHVPDDGDRLGDGDGALAREPLAERASLHERHRVVRQPVGRAGREQRDDVRLLEARGELDLAREPLRGEPGGEVGVQDLHHHVALQRYVAGEEDAAHAAAAQLTRQRVRGPKGGLQPVVERVGRHGSSWGERKRTDPSARI